MLFRVNTTKTTNIRISKRKNVTGKTSPGKKHPVIELDIHLYKVDNDYESNRG